MRKLILVLLFPLISFSPLVSFGQFNMQLFPNYKSEILNKNELLSATLEKNENISTITISFSDDPSFKSIKNKELINWLLSENVELELKPVYQDLNIIKKEVIYIKNLGDCFHLVYSGNHIETNIMSFNTRTQFIKNDNLYVISTASLPEESFSRNYQDYLKMFSTITF
jgi:hypothetical protein